MQSFTVGIKLERTKFLAGEKERKHTFDVCLGWRRTNNGRTVASLWKFFRMAWYVFSFFFLLSARHHNYITIYHILALREERERERGRIGDKQRVQWARESFSGWMVCLSIFLSTLRHHHITTSPHPSTSALRREREREREKEIEIKENCWRVWFCSLPFFRTPRCQ